MTKLVTIPAEEDATLLPQKPKTAGIRRVVAAAALASFVIGERRGALRDCVWTQERREDPRQEVQGRFQHAAVADRPDVRPRKRSARRPRPRRAGVPFATDPVALARAA